MSQQALIHKIGINCGKQVRRETDNASEVTCLVCIRIMSEKSKREEGYYWVKVSYRGEIRDVVAHWQGDDWYIPAVSGRIPVNREKFEIDIKEINETRIPEPRAKAFILNIEDKLVQLWRDYPTVNIIYFTSDGQHYLENQERMAIGYANTLSDQSIILYKRPEV